MRLPALWTPSHSRREFWRRRALHWGRGLSSRRVSLRSRFARLRHFAKWHMAALVLALAAGRLDGSEPLRWTGRLREDPIRVLQNFLLGQLWVGRDQDKPAFKNLIAEAHSLGIRVVHEIAGAEFNWGGATGDVLWPLD
jgi:hypothetical protein